MKRAIGIFCLCSVLFAFNKGELGYDYLRIPFTPRGYLFMFSRVAYPCGTDAVAFNPALISEEGISFSASSYVTGIKMGILSASLKGDWGASILYLNSGSMERIDENGNVLGNFSTSHLALCAAKKSKFRENMAFGVGIKLLYQSILDYSSLGVAFDIGAVYRYPSIDGLILGAALRNLGYELKPFVDERSMPPAELLLGATYETGALTLGLGISSALDRSFALSLTGQWEVSRYLTFGVGYTTDRRDLDTGSGKDILNGLSAGFDISYRSIEVTYSFTPFGDLGDIHTIGVQYNLKH